MVDQLLQYLDTAPIAVAFIVYVYFSDKQKSKMMERIKEMMEGYKDMIGKNQETTDKLINLVEELTRKK